MNDLEIVTRLVLLLDAAIPALEKAANAERRREAGKHMRQITEQNRAEYARELVDEVSKAYGIDLGYGP